MNTENIGKQVGVEITEVGIDQSNKFGKFGKIEEGWFSKNITIRAGETLTYNQLVEIARIKRQYYNAALFYLIIGLSLAIPSGIHDHIRTAAIVGCGYGISMTLDSIYECEVASIKLGPNDTLNQRIFSQLSTFFITTAWSLLTMAILYFFSKF